MLPRLNLVCSSTSQVPSAVPSEIARSCLQKLLCLVAGQALEDGKGMALSLTGSQVKLLCLIAGRALEDGKGSLADGTQFDRQSGEEHGPNGYWFRWHRLKGKSGKVSSSKAQNTISNDNGII